MLYSVTEGGFYMMATHQPGQYDVNKSSNRMDDILNSNNSNFSDSDIIPNRSSLTFTNGYYVNVTALFIDIVDSSDMTDVHYRPTLAKIYRCFLSECVAIINSSDICKEININGDCVWGVFETPKKKDIDSVVDLSACLYSLIKILNYKLKKRNYSTINVGIGIDYGRALMVKAGYSGSGINDVVWMGDVVNKACHLANSAGRNQRKTVIISSAIYGNLCDDNKSLFSSFYSGNWELQYEGTIVNLKMEDWYNKNCK